MMKICVFGAGAIGGLVGGRLAAAGHDVTLVARGANLAAMRESGLKVDDRGDRFEVRPRATDDPAEIEPQDAVILTMKAHGVGRAAQQLAPLLNDDTTVVTLQNGLPWWYFYATGGALDGQAMQSVDPGGDILAAIPANRVIGGVVSAATTVVEPGTIKCVGGGAITLGEIDGSETARLDSLTDALGRAGFTARKTPDIRGEIWAKLWGNVSFSAIAVLTSSPLGAIVAEPALRALGRQIMEEAQSVAEALGIAFPITIDQRLDQSKTMGGHKTSILQDLEAGRPMEVDAMIGSVIEAGRRAGIATPITDMMYAMVRRRAREAGCYPENAAFEAVIGRT